MSGKSLSSEIQKVVDNNIIINYVQRWGSTTSSALLDPQCKIFTTPNVEGIIGYRFHARCAVVFGEPLCEPNNILALTNEFHNFCKGGAKNIIYVNVTNQFKNLMQTQGLATTAIEMGSEIILDPSFDVLSTKGSKASNLRNKYNQALRSGIMVKEYKEYNLAIEQEIEQIKTAWLKKRTGPQMCLMSIDIFSDRVTKRWFYALQNNRIIGVTILNRIDARQGWFLNISLLTPDAPKFVAEVLVLSILETLRAENYHFLSVGTMPIDKLGQLEGLSTFKKWLAYTAFKIVKNCFKLNTRAKYWEKFNPAAEPSFLLCSSSKIGLREIIAIIRAYNVSL